MANRIIDRITKQFASPTQTSIEALTHRLGIERQKLAELEAAVGGAAPGRPDRKC
jgi:hypothetical protein